MIVPRHWLGVAVRGTPSGFRCVRVASLDHHADGLERIGDDLTLGWTNDVGLASEDQDENADVEHDEAHDERSPEALGFLHERSCDQRQGSKVNTPVEHPRSSTLASTSTIGVSRFADIHVDALVCDRRIDDGAFSSLLDLDGHGAALILICDQRGDVGLDTASAEADNDDGRDVSTESMASGDRCGKGSCPENQQTNPVDRGEDQDSVVFAEILIGDDGYQEN